MNRKQCLKRLIDLCMTLLLLFLMGYQIWGEAAHEWAGAGIFLLFILHHILNRSWYRNLFRGKYSAMRFCMLVTDILLFAAMFSMMFSAIILSQYVFSFLPIRGLMRIARMLHMGGAYWSFVLMTFHLGLHWNMMIRRIKWSSRKGCFYVATLIALYGLWVLVKRDIGTYLFLRTEFVFLDYGESRTLFYLDYLAMMGLFIYLAHYVGKFLQRLGRSNKKGE